jgi:hypothetical protein
MNQSERNNIEHQIWRRTHKDYRSEKSSPTHPSILVYDNQSGTCIQPLSNLSEEELLNKLRDQVCR